MGKCTLLLWSFLQRFLILLGTLVIGISLPFLPLGLVILFILRKSVELVSKIFRPDLAEVFGDAGVVCALENVYVRPKLNIVFHCVLNRPVQLDQLRKHFEQRVINYQDESKGGYKYARLRQTWTQFLGFFFWKWDDFFNINHHVRIYDYTEPSLMLPEVCVENDLRRVTSALVTKPYRKGRSPWEILLVPKYCHNETVESSVLVLRIHHAVADGFSVLKLLFRLADNDDIQLPQAKFPVLTTGQKILRNLVVAVRAPYDIAKVAVDAYDGANCWHIVNEKLSGEYETFFSDPIEVRIIKGIMKEYKVNYNAAVYSITAGAMTRLMKEVGQKVPEKFSVVVPSPLPEHPGGLVNHLSAHIFKFSARISSARGRLTQVSKRVKQADELDAIPIIFSWFSLIATLVPVWALRLVYDRAMMTVGMTSLPGPVEELDLFDNVRVTELIPALGHFPGKLGAVAMLLSTAGKQRIAVTVERNVFEGFDVPQDFATHVRKEVEALWSEC